MLLGTVHSIFFRAGNPSLSRLSHLRRILAKVFVGWSMVLIISSRALQRIGPLLGRLELFANLMGSFGDRQGSIGENLTTDSGDILYEETEICIDE